MTDDTTWRARSIPCPLCGAKVGDDCVTKSGRTFTRVGVPGLHFHVARVEKATEPIRTKTGKILTDEDIQALADEAEHGYDVSHLRNELRRKGLPKKLKHKVRVVSYVWCDHHGAIHPDQRDYYDEGGYDCEMFNWRRVYVESDDKNEAF